MKKINLFFILAIILLASCQDKNAFVVEGHFTENTYNDKTVYLQQLDSMQMPVVIDSSVVKDSKFSFHGILKQNPSVGFVSVGKLIDRDPYQPDNSPLGTLILESGTAHITFDKMAVTVAGTPRNEEFNKVYVKLNELSAFYDDITKTGDIDSVFASAQGEELKTKMDKQYNEVIELTYTLAKANMANAVGEYFFKTSGESFSMAQKLELIALASEVFQNQPQVKALKVFCEETIQKEQGSNQEGESINRPFTDVELNDANGKKINLSAYVGKGNYVLIDFWASWCGPCMQEMPSLVKLYAKYKAKGFKIVGISLDQEKDAWQAAVKSANMSWVQLHDAEGTAAKTYNVTTIPHTLLVDGDGNIIAMELRGEELEQKLAELIK